MINRLLADIVMLVHAIFIALVCLGALLAYALPWLLWLQVPAMLYGVGILWIGWICPLTPLEKSLRRRAGQTPYAGDFLGHYVFRNDAAPYNEARADRRSAVALFGFNLVTYLVLAAQM